MPGPSEFLEFVEREPELEIDLKWTAELLSPGCGLAPMFQLPCWRPLPACCFKMRRQSEHSWVDVFAMRISVKNFLLLAIFLVLWTGIHHLSGLHVDPGKLPNRSAMLRSVFASALGSVFFLLFPLFSQDRSSMLLPTFIFFAVALSASLGVRSLLWSSPAARFQKCFASHPDRNRRKRPPRASAPEVIGGRRTQSLSRPWLRRFAFAARSSRRHCKGSSRAVN